MDTQLLDQLEQEHREVEAMLRELAKATEADQQQRITQDIARALETHMRIEEREVYPELQRLDGEMSTEANVEHGLAREELEKVQEMIGQPGFGAAVAMLEAGIAHHVEEEEHEAFPKLRGEEGGSRTGDEPTRDELYELAKEQGVEGRSQMSKAELSRAVKH